MPVIKHFDGNCHVYVDAAADLEMALLIIVNSKCQRIDVCNTAESLLVHGDVAAEFLPTIAADLAQHSIEIRGDERVCELVDAAKPATEADYKAEFWGQSSRPASLARSMRRSPTSIATRVAPHRCDRDGRDLAASERFAAAVDSGGSDD